MQRIILSFASLVLVFAVAAPAAAQPENLDTLREEARNRALEKRESREDRVAEIKQEVEARKLELQQERCVRLQNRLESAMPRLGTSANRVKGNFDKVYERVQGFYETGQLTVANYDEQVEAIEVAKANAEAALETLENYEFEVDCENQNVGSQLDGFRTAVKDARAEIKAYHKALVGLVSSMRAAAAEQNVDNEEEAELESEENEQSEEEATDEQ